MNTPLPQAQVGRAGAAIAALLAGWASIAILVGGSTRGAPPLRPASFQPAAREAAPPKQEAVVVMGDGTRYTGMLLDQTDERIVLEIGGIRLNLRREEIARIDILAPVLERYRRMREAIADDDIPQLLTLVDWLVSRREYDAASQELLRIRRIEPRNPRALELERLIEAQRTLQAGAPSGDDAQGGGDDSTASDPDARAKEPITVLSPEEINLIRVYELDLDHLPRVVIQRDTVERLLEEYRGDPLIPTTEEGRDDLFRAARSNPRRIIEIIFKLKARHLYSQVQVIDNPRAMQIFRDRVHRTWLINGCASCHNTEPGAPAGPRLITRRPNSDATVYSNFLIIDRYRLADGTALIDYDNPGESPLLQMGMPRANVRWAHPDTRDARGWSPVFLGENSTAYQNAVLWIKSMYRPRPEYPIDYPPQGEEEPPAPAEPPVAR